MTTTHKIAICFSILISFLLLSCTAQQEKTLPVPPLESHPEKTATVDVEFTLQTIAEKGKLLYIGVGGEIDGITNPDLVVPPGAVVHITLVNGDGMTHDFYLPDFNVKTEYVKKIGDRADIKITTDNMQPGSYVYYCTLPGHRKAGQEGKLIVIEP